MSTTADFDSALTSHAGDRHECSSCKSDLGNCYYQADSATLCGECATAVEQGRAPSGSRFGRFMKALLLGSVAAAIGAAIQFSVLHFFNLNVALVTIFMGIIIGAAVRAGSGNRGGWRYQIIAVLLTYMAISAAYIPMAIAELKTAHDKHEAGIPLADPVPGEALHARVPVVKSKSAALGALGADADAPPTLVQFVIALFVVFFGFLALPVLVGIGSPLNLLIFGFGLFQAWKSCKATPTEVTGPHWRTMQTPPPLPA